jgi:hypothetical protein
VADANYFTTAHSRGPLTAPSSTASGGNGTYAYSAGTAFPTNSYQASNYWVDVVFTQPALSPVATDDSGFLTPFNTAFSVQASALLANDSDPNADPLVITSVGNAQNGTVALQSNIVTFTPTANYAGPASFTYDISDGQGGSDTGQVFLNVDPQGIQNLLASATPAAVTVNDPGDVELGMKFQADVAGWITGFRFYKGPENVGTHEAHLWSNTGTLLASATFTNETASGWQSVNLPQDIHIDANTTYVVSYHSDGFYSATPNFFDTEISNNNLHGLSSQSSGGNGVYGYGPSGLFPTNNFSASNYYVDVAFRPQLATV